MLLVSIRSYWLQKWQQCHFSFYHTRSHHSLGKGYTLLAKVHCALCPGWQGAITIWYLCKTADRLSRGQTQSGRFLYPGNVAPLGFPAPAKGSSQWILFQPGTGAAICSSSPKAHPKPQPHKQITFPGRVTLVTYKQTFFCWVKVIVFLHHYKLFQRYFAHTTSSSETLRGLTQEIYKNATPQHSNV